MHRLDEGDALGFLCMGLEKGDALLQALYIVSYSTASIARIAHPATKRPGVMTMIENKPSGRPTAALTKTVLRFRRTVFF
jgi:hypothetical protein